MKLVRFTILTGCLATLSSCDNKRDANNQSSREAEAIKGSAREFVDLVGSVPEMVREAPDFLKSMILMFRELHSLVAENDYARARKIASDIDGFLETRALSWYVRILVTEEIEGPAAASAQIEELLNSQDIVPTERDALLKLKPFIGGKGDLKSSDLLLTLGGIIVEKKYGKGAGTAFLFLQDTFHPSELSAHVLKAALYGEHTPSATSQEADAQ